MKRAWGALGKQKTAASGLGSGWGGLGRRGGLDSRLGRRLGRGAAELADDVAHEAGEDHHATCVPDARVPWAHVERRLGSDGLREWRSEGGAVPGRREREGAHQSTASS